LWLGVTIFIRGGSDSQMAFWQIAAVIFLSGAGLPLFFLPLTGMALGSVDKDETAGAAGLMSFIRTLSGAFATSIVNTIWENKATSNQTELVGIMHDTQTTMDGLVHGGMSDGQAVSAITQMVQGQATMLATNQVFFDTAIVFGLAAAAIWLAPKPTRTASPGMAH
jgi:DHA2 family multidrug resistance protein